MTSKVLLVEGKQTIVVIVCATAIYEAEAKMVSKGRISQCAMAYVVECFKRATSLHQPQAMMICNIS